MYDNIRIHARAYGPWLGPDMVMQRRKQLQTGRRFPLKLKGFMLMTSPATEWGHESPIPLNALSLFALLAARAKTIFGTSNYLLHPSI